MGGRRLDWEWARKGLLGREAVVSGVSVCECECTSYNVNVTGFLSNHLLLPSLLTSILPYPTPLLSNPK